MAEGQNYGSAIQEENPQDTKKLAKAKDCVPISHCGPCTGCACLAGHDDSLSRTPGYQIEESCGFHRDPAPRAFRFSDPEGTVVFTPCFLGSKIVARVYKILDMKPNLSETPRGKPRGIFSAA
jgi:hypothetical protein